MPSNQSWKISIFLFFDGVLEEILRGDPCLPRVFTAISLSCTEYDLWWNALIFLCLESISLKYAIEKLTRLQLQSNAKLLSQSKELLASLSFCIKAANLDAVR